jgi:hypothetical protein
MNVDVIPTLIEQFRETFEGEVRPGSCWITDGRPDCGVFGVIETLSVEDAFAEPTPGGKSVAAHVEHLRFSLDLMIERCQSKDPRPDWKSSFNIPPASADAWASLQTELRRAYDGVLEIINAQRDTPPQDWQPIHLVGLAAITAHNAYHLGSIRQIARVVQSR